ncbi:MAG TPA: chemotaxis protein CheW [Gemmatimonadales bacterium]|nr:chemotaxis protein CheW [Gemmatimonadales bacterium]
MTGAGAAWLLVRAGGRLVGLSLPRVVEVLQPEAAHPVPSREPAVRGITSVRGRLLPVVHLGALLEGAACPTVRSETAVVVEVGARRICLEVEDAEEVLLDTGFPVPAGTTLPWASAVARHRDVLVPLLDLDALGARITETALA